MDMYRRNNLKHWFADAGFLYLIVATSVSLVFLLKEMDYPIVSSGRPVPEPLANYYSQ